MKKEELLKRVQDLSKAVAESLENHNRLKTMVDNSASQHNALAGRLEEAHYLYNEVLKEETEKVAGKPDKTKS